MGQDSLFIGEHGALEADPDTLLAGAVDTATKDAIN
jgi:hypothetical protein